MVFLLRIRQTNIMRVLVMDLLRILGGYRRLGEISPCCRKLTNKESDFTPILGFEHCRDLVNALLVIEAFIYEKGMTLAGVFTYVEWSCTLPLWKGKKQKLEFSSKPEEASPSSIAPFRSLRLMIATLTPMGMEFSTPCSRLAHYYSFYASMAIPVPILLRSGCMSLPPIKILYISCKMHDLANVG